MNRYMIAMNKSINCLNKMLFIRFTQRKKTYGTLEFQWSIWRMRNFSESYLRLLFIYYCQADVFSLEYRCARTFCMLSESISKLNKWLICSQGVKLFNDMAKLMVRNNTKKEHDQCLVLLVLAATSTWSLAISRWNILFCVSIKFVDSTSYPLNLKVCYRDGRYRMKRWSR